MLGDLRARLARLGSAAEPAEGTASGPSSGSESSLPFRLRARDERAIRRALDELPGRVLETPAGPVYLASTSFGASHRHGGAAIADAREASAADLARIALDESLESFRVDGAVFLDTETSGLSGGTGTIAFLIGIGRFDTDGSFVVEQLFVREPCEERAALDFLAERLAAASAIVSFNGKSFDVPLLKTRFVLSRLPPPRDCLHLDLLHPSRRLFKRRLSECRLGSLESHVLGFVREGDIPGSMIPGIYQDFLVSGATSLLEAVFQHNVQDVVALPALLGVLGRACARPEGEHDLDRIGLAQIALRAGSADEAERILGSIEAREGRHLYANVLRRRGARADAAAVWRGLLSSDPSDAEAHLALAKHTEHVERDPVRALEHARAALGAEEARAGEKRIARLMRKLAPEKPTALPRAAARR
ncbi:MAG: ribonuclease H-like domain-containing protein [Deltaproteobacteria bacterium]|nr:ribonuclease H-like domain-containing protein [Deltaproteobacteria bacterium]